MNKHEETLEVLRSYRKKMKKFRKDNDEIVLADDASLVDAIFISGMAVGVCDLLEKTVIANLNWEHGSLSDEDQELADELTSMKNDAIAVFMQTLKN